MKFKFIAKAIVSCCTGAAIFLSPHIPLQSHSAGGLNITAYMDSTDTAVYGVPTAFLYRFPTIISRTENYYASQNINVNIAFTSQNIRATPARNCADNSSDFYNIVRNGCKCVTNTQCENGNRHHSNAETFKNSFVSPTSSNSATWLITASYICGHNGTSGSHHGLNGVTWSSQRKMVTCDYDFKMQEQHPDYDPYVFATKTAVHEIGHLYGVTDHYTVLPDQYPNCIWGLNHNVYDISKKLTTCTRCKTTLSNNKNKY